MSKAVKVSDMQNGVWYRHIESKTEMLYQEQEDEQEVVTLSGKVKTKIVKSEVMLCHGFLGQLNVWGTPHDGQFELCQD